MTLREAVHNLNETYAKKTALVKKEYEHLPDAVVEESRRFLFRGEKLYPTTMSNYHRGPILSAEKDYILDLCVGIHSSLFGGTFKYANRLEIGAFLQHYGFNLMWLDCTDSVEIAAFFATCGNDSGKGRIMILDSVKLMEMGHDIIELRHARAKRPQMQSAYVLRMYDDMRDLQNIEDFGEAVSSIEFEVTEEDVVFFDRSEVLCTDGDDIADFIIEYISDNPASDTSIKKRMDAIKNTLLQHRK